MYKQAKVDANKINFLDGLRGIMAINVVICHFVCVFYPQMYFKEYSDGMGGY